MDMMTALVTYLEDEEKSVASAELWLKGHMGSEYESTLREVGFGKHLAEAFRLFEPPLPIGKAGLLREDGLTVRRCVKFT